MIRHFQFSFDTFVRCTFLPTNAYSSVDFDWYRLYYVVAADDDDDDDDPRQRCCRPTAVCVSVKFIPPYCVRECTKVAYGWCRLVSTRQSRQTK